VNATEEPSSALLVNHDDAIQGSAYERVAGTLVGDESLTDTATVSDGRRPASTTIGVPCSPR